MTGKELLLAALRNEQTPRPAWVPFVGCHGGHLIGQSADAYLNSADHLVEGLRAAHEAYRPDGLPVVFDLHVEAEILGCDLRWAADVPPAVTSHPLAKGALRDLPPYDVSRGRMPLILDALDRAQEVFSDEVALYGLVCGPFTLALHLLGNDIFLEMFDHPDRVREVVDFAADVAIRTADAYLDHGATVIAVVDPMTSQISPEHFENFVAAGVNKVFDAIRARGGLSSMFVCGDVTRNLEVLCATHADNVSVDEQIPLDRLADLCRPAGKSFGGNIKLTSVLLLGDERDAKLEVLGILDQVGDRGFILAPGCDLPFHTPPANLRAVAEMVHDEYQRDVARRSLRNREEDRFEDIRVPDYGDRPDVTVDVITLDSTSCAPCQYMMEAVERAAEACRARVFINEHKIKVREGIGMMVKLGVKNLPTVCIDGEVAFASIIPDQKSLVAALEARIAAKARPGG